MKCILCAWQWDWPLAALDGTYTARDRTCVCCKAGQYGKGTGAKHHCSHCCEPVDVSWCREVYCVNSAQYMFSTFDQRMQSSTPGVVSFILVHLQICSQGPTKHNKQSAQSAASWRILCSTVSLRTPRKCMVKSHIHQPQSQSASASQIQSQVIHNLKSPDSSLQCTHNTVQSEQDVLTSLLRVCVVKKRPRPHCVEFLLAYHAVSVYQAAKPSPTITGALCSTL